MTYDREVLRAMARARTHTDLAAAQPGAGSAASPDDVASQLRSAIDGLDDEALRSAAEALFPLPYEHPATPLTERRRLAAACFYVSPSTFRTSGPNAPSREERVLDALAEALNAGSPQGDEPTVSARPRRSPLRLALAGALVLPLIVALAMAGGDGDRGAVVQASEESARDGGQLPGGRRNRSVETDGEGGALTDDHSTATAPNATPTTGLAAPGVVFQPRRPSAGGLLPRSAVTLPASQTAPLATTGPMTDPNPRVVPPQPAPVARSGTAAGSTKSAPGPAPSTESTPSPAPGPTSTTAAATTVVASLTISNTSSTPNTSTSTAAAAAPPGLACPGVELAVDQARLARVIAVLDGLGRPSDACQQSAAQVFSDLSFAEYLIAGDAAPWTELGFADGHSLAVPQSAWRSYRSAVEHLGGVPAAGRPADWTLANDGRSTLETTTGVIVTGERTDIKHHYLTPPFLAPWLANRERLGQPMGHVPNEERDLNDDGADFEHGRITMVDERPVITTVTPLQARAMLPSASELADSIIRQPDGTGWYVDSQLRRWWIPDGGVWGCLGGWDNVSADNVPAAAVATMPVAGRGGCSLL